MKDKIGYIIFCLISNIGSKAALTGINIANQFCNDEKTDEATLRNLNAAFLISLCGTIHPHYLRALNYIEKLEKDSEWKETAQFYLNGLSLIYNEIEKRAVHDISFTENLEQLYVRLKENENASKNNEIINQVWRFFFPEGVSIFNNRLEKIESLRRKRRIRITRLNPLPILEPAKEILFTSNVLLTVPPTGMNLADLFLPERLKEQIIGVMNEPQLFWYDHPIQVGMGAKKNEMVHGLKELDQAIEFEKEHGTVDGKTKVHCLLSVSVTHKGLQGMAKDYLKHLFEKSIELRHLHVYAITEYDTARFVEQVLMPGARHYLGLDDDNLLHTIIGVDGRYGRHYSFLKAVSAFWHVFLDPNIRATFKIDLDQAFPQAALIRESGVSALEHFKTPIWGAEGVDEDDQKVELGMIAGALVNQEDVENSIFTPDVLFPDDNIKGDEWIFFSPLPQALSTEAEMMSRYGEGSLKNRDICIQRIHVTGGTCGILVDSLRKHRPFTPSLIGRAEDQAYLLSVLFKGDGCKLRYVHEDGLIMRHDKKSFAGGAIKAAYTGKLIADYVRILLFSYYVKGLPWPVEKIKKSIDPFTGCFVSYIPFTLVYLRLALKGASLFKEKRKTDGFDLLKLGVKRLSGAIDKLQKRPNLLKDKFWDEKKSWDIFYDVLDLVEKGLKEKDQFAMELKKRATGIINECKINL